MQAEAVPSISAMKKEFLRYTQENACTGVSFKWSCKSQPTTLWKKRLPCRCFPVSFAKKTFRCTFFSTPSGTALDLPKNTASSHNICSNSPLLNGRLKFWEGKCCHPISSWNLPFFEIILSWMSDIYQFFKLNTLFTNLLWKFWLLVTKVDACVALCHYSHHEL